MLLEMPELSSNRLNPILELAFRRKQSSPQGLLKAKTEFNSSKLNTDKIKKTIKGNSNSMGNLHTLLETIKVGAKPEN